MTLIQRGQRDKLTVQRFTTRAALGVAAAAEAAQHIRQLLTAQPRVRMIFAAAPSQREFLAGLVQARDIDWGRIEAFHMDEYIGLDNYAPQRFSQFLCQHLFRALPFAAVHLIPSSGEAERICRSYAALIAEAPIDIVCLGIGENGHLAFNDPPVARIDDPLPMKVVTLDAICRQQQVNDGCFARLEAVPQQAVTLTLPTLMAGKRLFCMVPGASKRQAVEATLFAPVDSACPATVLRQHPHCTLYCDSDACPEVIFD